MVHNYYAIVHDKTFSVMKFPLMVIALLAVAMEIMWDADSAQPRKLFNGPVSKKRCGLSTRL